MANINKVCATCGRAFTFTTSEQRFYQDKGFADPKNCAVCRRAAKLRSQSLTPSADKTCFECNENMVRGVVVDAESKCLACGRLIEKSVKQYPVLAYHLRGGDGG